MVFDKNCMRQKGGKRNERHSSEDYYKRDKTS